MNKENVNVFAYSPGEMTFSIELSGISYVDTPFTINRTNSYCYILEYVVSGKGTVTCNGYTFNVRAGDAYLLPKSSTHTYSPTPSWQKIWFNFDGILVTSLLNAYGLENQIYFSGFQHEELFRELLDITKLQETSQVIMEKAAIQVHRILQEMGKQAKKAENSRSIHAILQLVNESVYDASLDLNEISKRLNLSKTYIINTFSNSYGITPFAYIKRKRLDLSLKMLSSSDMPIQEIATTLQFSDASHFSNSFKKQYSMTPKKFRESTHQEMVEEANMNLKGDIENKENLPYQLTLNRKS